LYQESFPRKKYWKQNRVSVIGCKSGNIGFNLTLIGIPFAANGKLIDIYFFPTTAKRVLKELWTFLANISKEQQKRGQLPQQEA